MRYRIDGVLYEVMYPPPKLQESITSRLKIMATPGHRREAAPAGRPHPDEDRSATGQDIDFRVSVLPTLFGEKIVLRLLDKDNLCST